MEVGENPTESESRILQSWKFQLLENIRRHVNFDRKGIAA